MTRIYVDGVEQGVVPPLSGISTEYLDGTGNWSTPAGGGGGGASPWDATVGATGADYTTVVAAWNAGYRNLLAVDDITETASLTINLADTTSVYIPPGINWDTAGFQFNTSATAIWHIQIEGKLTKGTQAATFVFDTTNSLCHMYGGGVVDNNGTSSVSNYIIEGNMLVDGITCELPNKIRSGFHCAGTDQALIQNVTFKGGGTACSIPIEMTSPTAFGIQNIVFAGTFSTSVALMNLDGAVFNIVGVTNSTSQKLIVQVGSTSQGMLDDFSNSTSGQWTINVTTFRDGTITNVHYNGGDFDPGNATRCYFGKLTEIANMDCTDANLKYNVFESFRVTNSVTFGGSDNKYSFGDFLAGGTINDVPLNTFIACRGGPDASDSTTTFTDNNSANNTAFVGCYTCAALAGTGTPATAAHRTY
jgi:hypothetical protein